MSASKSKPDADAVQLLAGLVLLAVGVGMLCFGYAREHGADGMNALLMGAGAGLGLAGAGFFVTALPLTWWRTTR